MNPSLLSALQNPFASLNSQLLMAAGLAGAGANGLLAGNGSGDPGSIVTNAGETMSPDSDQPEDLSVANRKEEGAGGGTELNSPSAGIDAESQQTWSYEEQFKQVSCFSNITWKSSDVFKTSLILR